ncbi:MAG: AraC family transcriptional regulator [Rhizobium sp.]
MSKTAEQIYHARMQRVLDHIERHLDEELTLERLSGVAAFSRHHFHRQFTALFGIPVNRYVQLMRLKRASYRLAFRNQDVTGIALDAGYEAPEAFARAFRQRFGQTPSAFRTAPDWEPWRDVLNPLEQARSTTMHNTFDPSTVTLVDMPATTVAVMPHRGDPARLGATIRRFIAWRREAGLTPRTSATFTVFHDPEPGNPADFHVDLCAATSAPLSATEAGVEAGTIPGGACAMLKVTGASDDLSRAANFLYREWLPASGRETRDFPLYCRRVTFFPDVPEHEAVSELYLPIKG